MVFRIKNSLEKSLRESKSLFLKFSNETAVSAISIVMLVILKSVILMPEKNLISSITLLSNSAEVISE